MRTTINNINAQLPEGYELNRGNGYFYFTGPDCGSWYQSGVYVAQLSALQVWAWVHEFHCLRGTLAEYLAEEA